MMDKTINSCLHEKFNDGYLHQCEGCGHSREYILGYEEATGQWNGIDKDGLPTEEGLYLWQYRDPPLVCTTQYFNNQHGKQWFERTYSAWRQAPKPYTPGEDK